MSAAATDMAGAAHDGSKRPKILKPWEGGARGKPAVSPVKRSEAAP